MRACVLLMIAAMPIFCESHPSWWTLVPPEATAIVGMDWQSLKDSPFGAPVAAELNASLGFPALSSLAAARQILIASPSLVAIATGDFNSVTLRVEAAKLGMNPASYHGVTLWIAPKPLLSVGLLNEGLLIAGERPALEAAIDRSQSEHRRYSLLLSRAARYAQTGLFVIADKLPDPLASIFVPIEGETRAFEGYVTVGDGLAVEASFDGGSDANAETIAAGIRQSIPSLPEVAQSLDVKVDGRDVYLSLELAQAEFAAALRSSPAQAQPQPVAAAPKAPEVKAKPSGPQVIRIFGLDDGPKEIVLPPVKPEKQ